MYVGGWPTFIARGAQSGSAVKNCNFGDLALEVAGNIGMVMFSKTRNCIVNLENSSASFTGTNVICRDAEVGISYGGSDLVGSDETSLTGGLCNFVNLAGGAFQYSGGSFSLTSAWNGRKVRYSGTTDITVTIPRRLPPGFEVEFVTTGATGIITITGASGLGVWSKNGLRSNGQYARIKVSQISPLGYHVTGDTQV